MRDFWRIMIEGSSALTIALILELAGGSILEAKAKTLILASYLLLLIPALNNMVGTLGTVIVARLTTALHLGVIEPKVKGDDELTANLIGVLVVGLITISFLQLLFFLFSIFFTINIPNFLVMIILLALSGILAVFLTVITGIFLTILSFRKGLDPNISIISIITAIGDIFGIGSLILVAMILNVI